jgi:hypothetical protein
MLTNKTINFLILLTKVAGYANPGASHPESQAIANIIIHTI